LADRQYNVCPLYLRLGLMRVMVLVVLSLVVLVAMVVLLLHLLPPQALLRVAQSLPRSAY
jgi:hypothetical protein